MSFKFIASISESHRSMLEEVKVERGLKSVQEALRSVLEDAYTRHRSMKTCATGINNGAEKQLVTA